MMSDTAVRIGIDVGGTFTDFALTMPGGIKSLKLPTTGDNPEKAILDGVGRLLAENSIAPDQVMAHPWPPTPSSPGPARVPHF